MKMQPRKTRIVFYGQLQAATEEVRTHDMLMIIGDLNARVGDKNRDRERVMGKHGFGTINNNGERLYDFYQKMT